MRPIVENQSYSPSKNVENEENPGITRFFRWKNYAENCETHFGKMFSSTEETALRKSQKAAMNWAFPYFSQFFQHKFETCSGLFRKAYKTSRFSILFPLFSSKSSCFSRFSALVSNHFHRFPHSLNKKWKTRKT